MIRLRKVWFSLQKRHMGEMTSEITGNLTFAKQFVPSKTSEVIDEGRREKRFHAMTPQCAINI